MKNVFLYVLTLFIVSVVAQDVAPNNDAAIVQTILTKCELTALTLEDVATMENGRVVTLDLKNRDISKDGISYLPPEIGNLTELRVLVCSGNMIDSIPPEIASCVNLQKLDCASNRITALPPAIGSLSKLTHLDVRHNRVETIAPEIADCKSLYLLQLTGNKLTELNIAVTKIASLKELYLKDNRLVTLPSAIAKNTYQYIDFIGNKLCTLPPALDAWAKKVDKRYKEQQKCW